MSPYSSRLIKPKAAQKYPPKLNDDLRLLAAQGAKSQATAKQMKLEKLKKDNIGLGE
jgi:hypothetical protein